MDPSTGLRPFLNALHADEEKQRFVALLTERVTEAYPMQSDGRVLFPFRRTFVIAYAQPVAAWPTAVST